WVDGCADQSRPRPGPPRPDPPRPPPPPPPGRRPAPGPPGRRPPPPPGPPPPCRSCASFTRSERPSSMQPSISWIAACAALPSENVTKPKPRDRPVSRSVMTFASTTSPKRSKASRRPSSLVFQLRPPTNNLLPIVSLLSSREPCNPGCSIGTVRCPCSASDRPAGKALVPCVCRASVPQRHPSPCVCPRQYRERSGPTPKIDVPR